MKCGAVSLPTNFVKTVGRLERQNLWQRLEPLRAGLASRAGVVPVRPELVAGVKFFGRYRSGAIRDGVLLSVG